MKTCYLDCFSGISGDMTVGALLDAGADQRELFAGLDSLGSGAAFEIERTKRRGIAASKFHVRGGDSRSHRHLPHILEMIERSRLTGRAKSSAARVFRRLGEAEARVHGIPIEKVHFHEVGAVDSICDIAGACLALDLLGIDEVASSAINTGSGTVNTEHGVLPVPAPATAALLEGKPVYARGPELELTTPTGAAIATALAQSFGALPAMRITATGYGAGGKDFKEHANVLRVILGERSDASEVTTVSVIEANIDDSTPEVLGYAMERLFDSGAVLDVTLSPLLMKKNRQGALLTVITAPEHRETAAEIVFAETSTLGLRMYDAERRVQARRFVEVDTGYGTVRIKTSGKDSFAPEFEDCRALAIRTGKPLKRVLADANLAYLKESR
jgi:uncharacterized protein (TIGR00299 family) protein